MANAESSEIAILPTAMTSAMTKLLQQHAPDRRARAHAAALLDHVRVVLDEVAAGPQRHRRREHLIGRQRGRDERDVDRERDDRDADPKHDVRDEGQDGALLDHQ